MDAAETPDGPETAAHDGGRPAWQHRLLAGGVEPDPRFTLANERTFLAWVRTALALLAGGVIAAPIAAWVVTRMNPIALGGVVGTLILFLNLPVVLKFLGVTEGLMFVRIAVLVLGAALSVRGVLKARENSRSAGEREGATVVDPEPARLR